jgi:hypothetical protein
LLLAGQDLSGVIVVFTGFLGAVDTTVAATITRLGRRRCFRRRSWCSI